jgi:hypothetical protein
MRYSHTEIQELQKHFTSYHFQNYCVESDDFTDALDIYQINIQLCEAFYPCFHTIEITLRNSIHNVLKEKHGQDWFSCNTLMLDDYERQEIDKAIEKLRRRGYVNISNNIISEMSFGFWKSLIQKKIYENSIWKPCCRSIFFYAKSHELDLKIMRDKIKKILYFRNKVFHHESVWNQEDICSIYTDIYQLIFWINPKVFTWSKKFDRFTEVYHKTSKLLDILDKQ